MTSNGKVAEWYCNERMPGRICLMISTILAYFRFLMLLRTNTYRESRLLFTISLGPDPTKIKINITH